MKKSFLSLSITLIAFTSCTKDETPNNNNTTTPSLTYPSTYRYSAIENRSAVSTFDKSGQINAPNHPSAADSNFSDLINTIKDGYSDTVTSFSLLSANSIRIRSEDLDTTLSYSLNGNKVQIAGAPFISS